MRFKLWSGVGVCVLGLETSLPRITGVFKGFLLLLCFTPLAQAIEQDIEVSDIARCLRENRAWLYNLQIRESIKRPAQKTPSDGPIHPMITMEWTSVPDGRLALVTTSRWTGEEEIIEHCGFDGQTVRAIGYRRELTADGLGEKIVIRGALLPDPKELLFEEPITTIYSLWLLGVDLDGRPLDEWLGSGGCDLTPSTPTSAHPQDIQVVVHVDAEKSYHVSLIPECGMTPRSIQLLRNGTVRYEVIGQDFWEAHPGVWIAKHGMKHTPGIINPDTGRQAESWAFTVDSLSFEPKVDDSLFAPVFPDGIEVVDRRFGWPRKIKWRAGMDPSEPASLLDEMTPEEREDAVLPTAPCEGVERTTSDTVSIHQPECANQSVQDAGKE